MEYKITNIIGNAGEMLNYILAICVNYQAIYGYDELMRGLILDQNYYISETVNGEYIAIDTQWVRLAEFKRI